MVTNISVPTETDLNRVYWDILRHNVNDYAYGVDYWSAYYWNFQNYNTIDESNSNCMKTNAYYYSALPYDELDDSSIDSNKWTTQTQGNGSLTEANYYIKAYAQSNSTVSTSYRAFYSNGSSASLNLKTEDCSVVCYVYIRTYSYTNQQTRAQLQISDGTNHVIVDELVGDINGEQEKSGYYEFVTDVSNNTVNVWKDGTQIQTDLSLSSISGEWNLRGYAYASQYSNYSDATGEIRIHVAGKMTGGGTDIDFIYDNTTGLTGSKFFESSRWSMGTCSGTDYYSIDNGSNYNTFTEREVIEAGTMTQLRFKFVISPPETIDTSKQNMARNVDLAYLYYLP